MIPSFQFQFFIFSLSYFLSEIFQYKTIIIESAIDVPPNKQQQTITEHFDIITTSDENEKITTTTMTKNDDDNINDEVTITEVQIVPTTITSGAVTRPKEVVSYQRFGRIDKKTIIYPFKCHLCGFSCRFKESLLTHFKQVHPY